MLFIEALEGVVVLWYLRQLRAESWTLIGDTLSQ